MGFVTCRFAKHCRVNIIFKIVYIALPSNVELDRMCGKSKLRNLFVLIMFIFLSYTHFLNFPVARNTLWTLCF